jgi:predicted O-linked N-acetylglucosamine transferase (SPINDLY family)
MFCSYATSPVRHKLKPVLNAIINRWLARAGIQIASSPRRLASRPRLVVIAEVLKSAHVQYRYFARYLRQLRRRFEVIIAAPTEQFDDFNRALADGVIHLSISDPQGVSTASRAIQEADPDVVFWPSVGMATWGPFLANLRFAPVQLAALGHSASTFSAAIDYFLTEEGYVSDPSLFSEVLLVLPDDSLKFEASPGALHLAPSIRVNPSTLRVAVASNALKLSPRFLEIVETIDKSARRALHFVLFPNARPIQTDAIARVVAKSLRSVDVMPRMDHNDYIQALSQCDMTLSSFPFGGLHSTIDSLSLGLPVVALQGSQPHERTDSLIIRRLGLPGWLIALNESDYVRASLRLAHDDNERITLSQAAVNATPSEAFCGSYAPEYKTAVADAVWTAYCHHERIQASNVRLWRLQSLLDLPQPRGAV